ncbi:MAG: DNA polymerase III subunit delta [Candidatus Aquirickettsiella sp.]
MQCRYEQLHQQLNNPVLAPIYFISGEEIVLIQAACNAIRIAAKKAGFSDRQVFYADTHFSGSSLISGMNNYGLFSEKQLLELHLSQGFSEAITQTLILYAKNPPPNKLLLIITGKLDRRLQQSAWFKSIDKVGLVIPIWPLQGPQLFRWVTERFHALGLEVEKAAIECLIFATEGNLLATAQTIEKLSLYFDAKNTIITTHMLTQALSANARFDPFKLTDAALEGNSERCLRILVHLKEEGIEPLLILWALSRECRLLASFAFELKLGKNLITLFKEQHIWEKRQLLIQQALTRHTLTHWYRLLGLASHIDRLIKGIDTGYVWNALQTLSLEIAEPSYTHSNWVLSKWREVDCELSNNIDKNLSAKSIL